MNVKFPWEEITTLWSKSSWNEKCDCSPNNRKVLSEYKWLKCNVLHVHMQKAVVAKNKSTYSKM